MTILFVANRFPYPPFRGDKLKIYNLARRLAKNHRLVLVTFTQDEQDVANIDKLKDVFERIETVHLPKWKSILSCSRFWFDKSPLQVLYFRSTAFQKLLHKVVKEEKPEVAHVQHLRMSQYLPQLQGIPAILDLPDAFSLYWKRRVEQASSFIHKSFNKMELSRVLRYEKVLSDFQLCLACSKEDVSFLEKEHNLKNLKVFPNGVDLDTFSSKEGHDYSQDKVLLFTGNMNYAPNVDAVEYFVKEMFPSVLAKHPNTRFVIAGQKPVPSVLALAADKVEVTGFVQDISVYYKQAAIVVAPLRFGAGTQNKVLEALAMGVPVVCSNIGFEGLGITSGEGAFMETDKNKFAERINELLSSETLRKTTGEKGMQIIRTEFDWNVLAEKLEKYLNEIAHG